MQISLFQKLDRLVMAEGDNEEALRSKRTIGVLRTLFPEISRVSFPNDR